jgi:hypothetical protein
VSPGDPDSPDRSCQEPVSTVRRHKQFADVALGLLRSAKVIDPPLLIDRANPIFNN